MIIRELNEYQAARAFSRQAPGFDEYDDSNTINRYKRERVRSHVLSHLPPSGAILELNAGTGRDAVYFARQGHRVHATDIAEGMLKVLREKVRREGLSDLITHELCSFTSLGQLQEKGPYDLVFSNFAGLNCTSELHKTLRSLIPLVKPGGKIALVILPKFCLWESLLLFQGQFRTATRRWFGSKGVRSHVEGQYFKSWYYSPSFVVRSLKDTFDLVSVEGLCTIVPPSYIEHFAEEHARLYRGLRKKEDRWKGKWPWKYIGDYYIITMQKKGQ